MKEIYAPLSDFLWPEKLRPKGEISHNENYMLSTIMNVLDGYMGQEVSAETIYAAASDITSALSPMEVPYAR